MLAGGLVSVSGDSADNVQHGVEDPSCDDQFRTDFAMMDLERVCKLGGVGIVGAPYQNHMDEGHAGEKRKDAPGHDLVFAEEAFIPDVAADKAGSYDEGAEDGAPPAVEKRGVVCDASAALGRRIVVEGAWQYHGG
jgi:hypothetical protein